MDKNIILAIDVGGTNLKIGVLNCSYKIIYKETVKTRLFKNKLELIDAIAALIDKIMRQRSIKKAAVLGLGIGVPGPVDSREGIVHFLPNIPGWREVPLKKLLEKRLRMRVFVDNDAKVMTLAEQTLGAARRFRNCLCLTLGTGVGGGLILEGKLYRGSDNASGEIGHLPINEVGPRCNCGGTACLEAYIGNNRILAEAARQFGSGITLERLSGLARSGNKKARAIWKKVGSRLGIALTAVVNVLNLDAVVIGGGVAQAGAVLFGPVKETIRKRAMSVQAKRVKVVRARLASDAGLVGAAVLAREGSS
jgi:glucokinase